MMHTAAGTRQAAPMNFAAAADALRRQEFARLAAAVTPTLEALRSLTPAPFREQIALMMERLGHTIITDPAAPDLVTVKEGRKFITACARPADPAPTGTRDLERLHNAVITANAQGGIYVTTRSFTAEAQEFAATLPIIQLADGEVLKRSMNLSLKRVVLPPTYKAMCQQCGEIVHHRLSKGETLPCINGHMVAPTIARASLARRKSAAAATGEQSPAPAVRPLTRREIRAHNFKVRARVMKQQQQGGG
jgi:hypothetical protein